MISTSAFVVALVIFVFALIAIIGAVIIGVAQEVGGDIEPERWSGQ